MNINKVGFLISVVDRLTKLSQSSAFEDDKRGKHFS